MEPFLQFIMLPLAVLAIVVLISFSYQKSKEFDLSPATTQWLIDIHAIATEGCQLTLVAIAIVDTAFCIETCIDMAEQRVAAGANAAISIEIFVLLSLILHYVAICSVDLIEAWVVLGDMGPAYERKPFILTRSAISSIVQKRPRQDSARKRDHAMRAVKDHVIRAVLSRTRPSSLDYLNLAVPEAVRRTAETDHQPPTVKRNVSSGSDLSTHQPGKHLTEDILTPPDSNQLKDTKRVKWAPTISVLSLTGVERRLSLP